jgi:hypothetical protein
MRSRMSDRYVTLVARRTTDRWIGRKRVGLAVAVAGLVVASLISGTAAASAPPPNAGLGAPLATSTGQCLANGGNMLTPFVTPLPEYLGEPSPSVTGNPEATGQYGTDVEVTATGSGDIGPTATGSGDPQDVYDGSAPFAAGDATWADVGALSPADLDLGCGQDLTYTATAYAAPTIPFTISGTVSSNPISNQAQSFSYSPVTSVKDSSGNSVATISVTATKGTIDVGFDLTVMNSDAEALQGSGILCFGSESCDTGELVITDYTSQPASWTVSVAAGYPPIKVLKNPRLTGLALGPSVRPTRITFAADGNDSVSGLRWQAWGGSVARATGVDHFDNCTPSCAQGHTVTIPARVTLSDPGDGYGWYVYQCYRLSFVGRSTAPGERFCLPGTTADRITTGGARIDSSPQALVVRALARSPSEPEASTSTRR